MLAGTRAEFPNFLILMKQTDRKEGHDTIELLMILTRIQVDLLV